VYRQRLATGWAASVQTATGYWLGGECTDSDGLRAGRRLATGWAASVRTAIGYGLGGECTDSDWLLAGR
jgi:hypothetical protein